jgi:hypothetical protein
MRWVGDLTFGNYTSGELADSHCATGVAPVGNIRGCLYFAVGAVRDSKGPEKS